MLPVLEGIIVRRILLNFRVDPAIVQRLLPAPLEAQIQRGYAIAGICLIRFEHLRPRYLPAFMGIASENMATRVAVRYPAADGMRPGVFIWRRDTDQKLVECLGGRVFPGVYRGARFAVSDSADRITFNAITRDGTGDVHLKARPGAWQSTLAFSEFSEVSGFFRQGACGFSCSATGDELEGMRLQTRSWNMAPLAVEDVRVAFYQDEQRFPKGAVEFDCGLIMRGVEHEWHEIEDVPQMAGIAR